MPASIRFQGDRETALAIGGGGGLDSPVTRKPISGLELSRKLGISHATVSYVLTGVAEKKKISAATIQRVREAAEKYNCVPNAAGLALKNRRTGIIGVILVNFTLDWAEAAMRGIQSVLDQADYIPFVATHGFDLKRNEKELISSLRRRDEGIIAFPMTGCDEIYKRIVASGVPLVFLGDRLPTLNRISSVTWAAENAVRSALNHLTTLGKKRIAFLGIDYEGLSSLHRTKAFIDGMRSARLPLRKDWILRLPSEIPPAEAVPDAIRHLFANKSDRPDAVFAMNDSLALPALDVLEEMGISVPGQVAVIGLGNLPATRYRGIGLTTVAEPIEEMGRSAAETVQGLIKGHVKAPAHLTIESSEVIVRRTTG